MLKTIDLISISIILFILSFICIYFFINNFWYAFFINILIFIFLIIVIKIAKKHINKRYTSKKLLRYFIIKGNEYFTQFLFNLIDIEEKKLKDNKYILANNNEVIYPFIKYGNVSIENIVSIYRLVKEKNCNKIDVIYTSIDRNTIIFANNLDISIEFIPFEHFYKYLKKNKKLPEYIENKSENVTKIKIKQIFYIIFNKKNIKYYLFTALIFLFLSFITPFKKYYIIFSIVQLVICFISLLPINKKVTLNNENYNKTFDNLLVKNRKNKK